MILSASQLFGIQWDVIFIQHLIVTFFPRPKFRDFQKIKEIKDL